MLYKPPTGRFKDNFAYWHDGRYYLYSMYSAEPWPTEDYRNVWLATSDDGVHWSDVGAVIADAPFEIWAMSIAKVGRTFRLNHGSFSRPGVQNVLRFWESEDLVHWAYTGPESDVRPDARFHDPDSRLDCMDVIPVVEDGRTVYYGYATGSGGLLRSEDGITWSGLPSPTVHWDAVPVPPSQDDGLEIGGCNQFGDRFYVVGGWFNYMGTTGYGVYTLTSDTPTGPFRPDPVYRLCGNSMRWVAMWARFCRTPDGPLVNGYMYSGYTYETPETWLPPLKQPRIDDGGHLRLSYWLGNEALKGSTVSIHGSGYAQQWPSASDEASGFTADAGSLVITAGPERGSQTVDLYLGRATTVVTLNELLDVASGVVIEGTLRASAGNPREVAPTAGIYLEEGPGVGTAILMHAFGLTQIGRVSLEGGFAFEAEDEIRPMAGPIAGIKPSTTHRFKLLARRNMFEFYLDDWLVQTFNTTHTPDAPGVTPRRVGFIAQNGRAVFESIRIWNMTLD